MPFYRTTEGRFVATQAEAGKGFLIYEMPGSKPVLIDLLNAETEEAFKRGARTANAAVEFGEGLSVDIPNDADFAEVDTSDIPEAGETFFEQATLKLPPCPMCGRDHEKAERAAKKLADGITADALTERLLDAEPWFVAKVFMALAERFTKGG